MSKIDPYTIDQEEICSRLGEHEVLMSFNNDNDAYVFRYWWQNFGQKYFDSFFEVNTDGSGNLKE